MSETPGRYDHNDYTVGWICALPETELVAAGAMLDEEHPVLPAADPQDTNSYLLGRIGDHNVVIACLPAETTGKVSAATVAKDMLRSFPAVRFGLMVGIGGGAPYYGSQGNDVESEQSDEDSEDEPEDVQDIRLGDVVISLHSKSTEAVVQYDFGKSVQAKEFIHIGGQLNKPPHIVLNAVSMLRGQHARKGPKLPKLLAKMLADNPLMAAKFSHPGSGKDRLFKSDVIHNEMKKSCKSCCGPENINLVKRKDRHSNDPQLHYGTIGSADQVLKDATLRDKWAQREKIKCFEMEAAGLMDSFPCLVIRGICDYADSHKNKVWQPYAAATAASYAKELLLVIPGQYVRNLPSIKQSLGRIAADVEMMRSNFDQMESSAILNWLSPVNYGPQQTDNLRRRQAGTGRWLLESIEFQNWVSAGKQTLFCPGIPGAGKTIMTAIVLNELYDKFQRDASVGIGYIYCNFRQHHEQKAEDLLASLLKQLCQQQSSLPEDVQVLYDRHKKKRTQPTLGELSTVLRSVTAMYSRVFIVVDALDESQLYDNCRTKFLSEILLLQAQCGANIFATSRFVPEIEKIFEGSMRIAIRASDDDVRRYLDGNLLQLPAFVTSNPDLLKEIKTAIVKAVDGMFLLARLHLDSLTGRTSRKSIRTTLQSLPTGSDAYDHAYKQAIERIEGQHKEQTALAKQVLSWITCAMRPLTSSELQHALAVELGTRELDWDNIPPVELMVSVCAGLVTIDQASRVIRLVHYTTQEYFERTQNHWFPDANTDITRTCVTYLSFSVFENYCQTHDKLLPRSESNELLDYAAQNWGHHARMSSIQGHALILDFLQNKASVSTCAHVLALSRIGYQLIGSDYQMTGLHIAVHFGLVQLTAALLNWQHNPSPKDSDGQTPLHYAADDGHQKIVKLLLDKGADPGVKDDLNMTPLYRAAENGHQEVVKLMLDKGADPGVKDDLNMTPLYCVVNYGHQDVVKLLLDKRADPRADNSFNRTPLHTAVKNGHQEVVKLLLDKGADPRVVDYFCMTPLHYAAKDGHQEVVKLLLDKGADPRIKDHFDMTPLHYAKRYRHPEVVKLLSGRDADGMSHFAAINRRQKKRK